MNIVVPKAAELMAVTLSDVNGNPIALPGNDRELVVTTYFCKTAFSGASVGDTITQTQIIDVTTSSPSTTSVVWRNQSTGTDFGSTPSAANLTLDGSQAMSLAQYQSMFVSGGLPVTGTFFQATQPVSAASLPLPTGAATDATLQARIPVNGQAAMASSVPVAIASNQSAIPVSGIFYQATQPVSAASLPLPAGAAQEAGGNLAVVSAASGTPADAAWSGSGNSTIVAALKAIYNKVAGSLSVTGTFWQATQPVSAASLPLPAGAAQEAGGNLASINTKLPSQGQALAAASLPVVLTSAQVTALTPPTSVQISSTDVTATGTITATDAVVAAPGGAGAFVSGASTAGSLVSLAIPGGATGWDMSILGLTSGNLYFEGSLDSTTGTDGNWINLNAKQSGLTGASIVTVATANGFYRGNISGMKYFRVRSVGALTGTPAIIVRLSLGVDALFLSAPLPAGSATIGAVTVSGVATSANQATEITSLASIDGKLSKAQATKANSLSVTFASDATTDVVGRVGSICSQGSFVPTVTASSAYATGNAVGGLITITSAVRSVPLSGLLQWVKVTSASAQASSSFDVFIFNAAPTAPTDKTAYSVASADLAKLISVIHCTDVTTAGGTIHQADNAARPFAVPSGTSIYAVIVVRGTPTFTATTDVTLSVGIVQD